MFVTRPLRKLDVITPEEMRKYHVLPSLGHITQCCHHPAWTRAVIMVRCVMSNVSCNDLNNELIRWLPREPTSPRCLIINIIH